jgi:hypothetical protein
MAMLRKETQNGKQENQTNNTKQEEILKEIFETTSKLSLIILPMISYLGDLEVEE